MCCCMVGCLDLSPLKSQQIHGALSHLQASKTEEFITKDATLIYCF